MEIVPARPVDLQLITDEVARMKLDGEDLRIEQFIVALEGDALLGFGRIKAYGGGVFELGSVGVLPEARRRGVGRAIVEELMRRFPTEEIYITTDLVEYFMRFGFTPTATAPAAITSKIDHVSSQRSGVVAMAMRRRRR